MKLRQWQQRCFDFILKNFILGQRSFLINASPGAGKTRLAAIIARYMLDHSFVNIVICLTPSREISISFREQLESMTGHSMDGLIGSKGTVITYQKLLSAQDEVEKLVATNKVLLICDEIHHCGGNDVALSNQWGRRLIDKIHNQVVCAINLSGTPWRSDELPVSMTAIHPNTNLTQIDFSYSLGEALIDNVCRVPNIVTIDNSEITAQKGEAESKRHDSLSSLISSGTGLQSVIDQPILRAKIIEASVDKLNHIRNSSSQAAGLIVCSSIERAELVALELYRDFGERAVIVTSDDPMAHDKLMQFKKGKGKWLVSVGMVSEGTDIPRLTVCCYLSRIKTEMNFRQVLGRILRKTEGYDVVENAFFYMFADPKLLAFAERLNEEAPALDLISSHEDKKAASKSPLDCNASGNQEGDAQDASETKVQDFNNPLRPGHSHVDPVHLTIAGSFIEQLLQLDFREISGESK